jgi:hypothetical protein
MAQHIYKNRLGVRLPSVTTILSRFKDSGGLLYWANTCGLEGKTLDEARAVPASAGTVAHALVEAAINKREPVLETDDEEVLRLARNAFKTYEKWRQLNRIEIRHTEVALVSERHQFGGRLDAIGIDAEQALILLDWKSANAIYADNLLQLGGYRILWEENYPDHPITGGFHLGRFAKEQGDFSHHYFPRLDDEAEAFLAMRNLYDRMKQIEKRVK